MWYDLNTALAHEHRTDLRREADQHRLARWSTPPAAAPCARAPILCRLQILRTRLAWR